MLLRMKVLAAACLCILPAAAHPSGGTTASSSATVSVHVASPKISAPLPTSFLITSSNNNSNKREAAPSVWRPLSPAKGTSIFKVIHLGKSTSTTTHGNEISEIPAGTRGLFIAPTLRTKEARQQEYFAGSPEVSVPPHIPRLLHEILFFDTIDHGKLVTALQQRRKQAKLNLLLLKSLRPYFPFFSYE